MISKTEKVRFSTRMVQVSRGSSMKIGQLPTANTNALTVRLRCLMSLRDDGWPIAHTLLNYELKDHSRAYYVSFSLPRLYNSSLMFSNSQHRFLKKPQEFRLSTDPKNHIEDYYFGDTNMAPRE